MRRPVFIAIFGSLGVAIIVAIALQPGTSPGPNAGPSETPGAVRFESDPPGAQVVGPAGPLGVTPFQTNFADERPESVVFRLEGHFPRQRTIAPDATLVNSKMLAK